MKDLYVYHYFILDRDGENIMGIAAANARSDLLHDLTQDHPDAKYIHVNPMPELQPEIAFGQFTGRVGIRRSDRRFA